MKTLVDIKMDYATLLEEGENTPLKEKAKISKIKKRLQFLNQAILWLENSPTAEYAQNCLNGLKKRYQSVYAKNPLRHSTNPIDKKEAKKWDIDNGIPKIKEQIKFLTYILH